MVIQPILAEQLCENQALSMPQKHELKHVLTAAGNKVTIAIRNTGSQAQIGTFFLFMGGEGTYIKCPQLFHGVKC